MSDLKAPVVEYAAEPHPNADALELAVVGGWRVCCRIGDFRPGQKVAHIPEQSVLPDDLIAEMGLDDPPRLAGKAHNRVKAIRLRGETSQGLIYAGPRIADLGIGDDAAEALRLVKWEPPIPAAMSGSVQPAGAAVNYDVENVKSWPHVLRPGEPVVVTEKLHGTLCVLGAHQPDADGPPVDVASSKGMFRQGLSLKLGEDVEENKHNVYVRMWRSYGAAVRAAWERYGSSPGGMFVFGEIVGPKIQDLRYGLTQIDWRVFDARVAGRWLDWEEIAYLASEIGAETVPVIAEGVAYSDDLLAEHSDGRSVLDSGQMREGIVVRPVRHRMDMNLGKVAVKSVSDDYLFRKGGTEHN